MNQGYYEDELLENKIFSSETLQEIKWVDCTFQDCDFSHAELDRVSFTNCDFQKCHFDSPSFLTANCVIALSNTALSSVFSGRN